MQLMTFNRLKFLVCNSIASESVKESEGWNDWDRADDIAFEVLDDLTSTEVLSIVSHDYELSLIHIHDIDEATELPTNLEGLAWAVLRQELTDYGVSIIQGEEGTDNEN